MAAKVGGRESEGWDLVRWFAAHTIANSERLANADLLAKGYRTFLPFLREQSYAGRQRSMRVIDRPLFSRYVFFQSTLPGHSFADVRKTDRVAGIVSMKFSGEPLSVPSRIMDVFRDMADVAGMIDLQSLNKFLCVPVNQHWFVGKPGDQVALVDEAPYFGLMARLVDISELESHDKVSVLVAMLGSARSVSIPTRAVASVLAA